jgi:hypothetical protein
MELGAGADGRGIARRQPDVGARKIAWLIRREGVAVSTSTVGRILKSLMQRGLVMPVHHRPP